jgi:hypothetical protein
MATEALTFQETLRTLGMLLDQSGSESAEIALSATGATVRPAAAWSWPREWSVEALARESARQRSWRGGRAPRGSRPDGVRWRLRVVGTALDAEGAGPCTISVQPDTVRVQKPDGHVRAYPTDTLERRAVLAPHLRGQAPPRA